MKKIAVLISIVVAALTFCQCGSDDSGSKCPTATCSAFMTQAQGQSAFDSDKDCMQQLDADNDGVACEELLNNGGGTVGGGTGGGGTSGCPTTANCGCSNKTKSECVGLCCQWTVGKGCGCK